MKMLRYFFIRKTVWKTTWFGKLTLLLLLLICVFLTRNFWLRCATSFITAKDTTRQADAILIEAWKYPHRSLIRASLELQSQGLGRRIFFVEYRPSRAGSTADMEIPRYYHEMLDLYFNGEGVDPKAVERIPVELKDPVTWNTAFDVTDALAARGCRSIIILSPWHHSRRSCDVYTTAGKKKGIEVFCRPVESGIRKDNWWRSHVGMSTVLGEVIKRIYYMLRIS